MVEVLALLFVVGIVLIVLAAEGEPKDRTHSWEPAVVDGKKKIRPSRDDYS